MAAFRRVYDSHHLQADSREQTGISSGTLRSVVEYGLPLPFYSLKHTKLPSATAVSHQTETEQ